MGKLTSILEFYFTKEVILAQAIKQDVNCLIIFELIIHEPTFVYLGF